MPPGRHPETLKNPSLELSFCPLPLPLPVPSDLDYRTALLSGTRNLRSRKGREREEE